MASSVRKTYGIGSATDDRSKATNPAVAPAGTNTAADPVSRPSVVQQYLQQSQAYTGGQQAPAYESSTQSPASLYPSPSQKYNFTYDVNSDALYQQYKDRYIQNAKRSMQDTMGQAASLTGGYGSTYGQAVGQQAYDETMRGLTDKIPELQMNAYGMWKDRQALAQQDYNTLSALIMNSGYQPTDEDLDNSGMTRSQADALRQAWMARNPKMAYANGAMTADQYFRLTGQYPPGFGDNGGGGGGGSRNGGSSLYTLDDLASDLASVKHSNQKEDLLKSYRSAVEQGLTDFSIQDLNSYILKNHL